MLAAFDSHNKIALAMVLPFLVGMLAVFPFWAMSEEEIYRKGHLTWKRIVWQSIKFGLVHMIVGVPLGAVVSLAMIGFFYAYKYRRTYYQIKGCHDDETVDTVAVLVSTSYHTMCNSLLVVILMGLIVYILAA